MPSDPSAEAPDPGAVWPQAVLDLLTAAGNRTVFEHGERHVSGTQMSSLIRRIAAGLGHAGVRPGDGLVPALGVDPEAFAAVLAAFAVGARVVACRPDQLDDVLAQADATVLDRSRLTALLTTPDDGEPLRAAGRPRDAARVIYTSGSTGRPKGCVQTYAALTAAWAAHPDRWPPAIRDLATRLDRYLVFGSLTSQVMLEYGVLSLAAGGTLVAADPPGYPAAITRHRGTAGVITVGRLHQLVRDQRSNPADLSTLRALMVSGSPLDPGRLRTALDVLGPVIFHGYGQTETGMIAMLTPAEMLADPDTLTTVGRPPAAVRLSLRDGELYVRTPAQACGYWNDPAETADVFTDGWVRTRDLATLDPHGRLHLVGRARDVIFVHAELVHAGAVERALAAHPGVAEAYVIGAPDDDTGEAVHAFVVPSPGARPDPAELRALVPGSGSPATVTLIDRVPLTAAGKPDKSRLRPPPTPTGTPARAPGR
ncbi:fatty acid--CoA ligase family protein [Paractinoplanes ferrugineus]|uniref:AMP-dependent synthetase n=1 Tax=Paractinoplanes ferrugineus TaxID=113564 RepID=A0A919MHE5_9ACTN|nr:fatty acid--CoA ligase family protein [Actinoplanes ferrugineus]GIE12555.1 AMP-dependent synthetase [Actinoplanes ferrugineus]